MIGDATSDKMVRKGLSVRCQFSREVTEGIQPFRYLDETNRANSRMGMCLVHSWMKGSLCGESEKRSWGEKRVSLDFI